MRATIALLGGLLVALSSCMRENPSGVGSTECKSASDTTQAVDIAAEEDTLRRANQGAMRAFEAGDATALDALYAEDAILVNPGAEPLRGRVAIDSLHSGEMAAESYDVTWESIEIEVSESGDMGYDFGRWSTSGTGPGGSVDDYGYYINVYRKIDGAWKTVVELNGSSRPKPASE